MNLEPMTTVFELGPIVKSLEALRNWPSGTILNGHRGSCVGNDY